MKVSIKKVKVLRVKDFVGEKVFACFLHQNPDNSKILRLAKKNWFISIFRAIVLREWSLDFSKERSPKKLYASGEGLVQIFFTLIFESEPAEKQKCVVNAELPRSSYS